MADPAVVVTTRRFSAAQLERRQAACDAAWTLARQGGYAAVSMDAVAARAGLSRATLYNYFASKDHLISEAFSLANRDRFTDVVGGLPEDASAHDRVLVLMEALCDQVVAEPLLAEATLLAESNMIGPGQAEDRMAPAIEAAIGDALDPGLRPDAVRALEYLQHVILRRFVKGRIDADEMRDELQSAVRIVLRP